MLQYIDLVLTLSATAWLVGWYVRKRLNRWKVDLGGDAFETFDGRMQ